MKVNACLMLQPAQRQRATLLRPARPWPEAERRTAESESHYFALHWTLDLVQMYHYQVGGVDDSDYTT